MEPPNAAASLIGGLRGSRKTVLLSRITRRSYLEQLERAGYYVEPLTDAGLEGCVAIWGESGGETYLVARERAVGEWEHD